MPGSLSDCSQERKAGQYYCSALDRVNDWGGGRCTLVYLTGSFIKHWTTMWRSEQHGRALYYGKRRVSRAGYITIGPVVGGDCGDPKQKKMGGRDDIDATVEKATLNSQTLNAEKDLLSLPNLLILQVRKLMTMPSR